MLPQRASVLPRRVLLNPRAPPTSQYVLQRVRWYSQQPPSATGQFYKTFTRPVAKCLLLALFTYQVVYWAWVKLEQDEKRSEREAEIARLEAQVETLQAAAREKEKLMEEPQQAVKKGWWPF